ncbi:hypothetical protein GPL17_27115 [Bradyrhizobium yuanmingense]|uniref:methyl-accepting chemotaxis protein n=1 Tax=Bradyrhizobium yuanmingense TaxID=108015 RepID=UPI0012FBED9A|nr:methyl-accepting chemotaxis protein [Bradyrhizobium yuanmingense]MVT54137.1 hypothetical protein [Bradyrhizobium yuanmingense]
MSALIKSHRSCSRMHWNVMQASTIANRFTEILSKANLLALTASVEAAHAGNDGRRFDLVAREVKLPAKRTAKTNSEIAGQIAGSGRTVAQLYRQNQQLILIGSYRFYRWVLLRGPRQSSLPQDAHHAPDIRRSGRWHSNSSSPCSRLRMRITQPASFKSRGRELIASQVVLI